MYFKKFLVSFGNPIGRSFQKAYQTEWVYEDQQSNLKDWGLLYFVERVERRVKWIETKEQIFCLQLSTHTQRKHEISVRRMYKID